MVFYVIIGCYSTSSCENLHLNAKYVGNANLTMELYEYKNVQIAYENYQDVTFICNVPNQPHFIRYHIDRETKKSE